MENSAGSAENEMSIIMDSLSYKINALTQTGVGIWQNLFQREDMGVVIDSLTSFMNVIDAVTEQLGLFKTVAAGAGIGVVVKSIA